MNRRIDDLLWRWAEAVHIEISGLGFSSQTIEYVAIQMGGVIIRGTPTPIVPSFRIERDLMEIDRAIKDMPQKWRDVVRARYLAGMGDKDGGEYLGIPPGTFRRYFDLAHAWLAGWMRL